MKERRAGKERRRKPKAPEGAASTEPSVFEKFAAQQLPAATRDTEPVTTHATPPHGDPLHETIAGQVETIDAIGEGIQEPGDTLESIPETLPEPDVKVIESINDLVPDPENANLGTERGDALLEWSMRNFGAGRSALADKKGRLIAGNKTVEKAVELGIPVRVVQTEGNELVVVQRTDLDLDEGTAARELAYADNRVSEVGLRWSTEQIQQDMLKGVELGPQFRMQELNELNVADLEGQAMMAGDDGGETMPNAPTILFGRWRFRLSREDAARFEAIIAGYLAQNVKMPKVHGWLIQPDLEALPAGMPDKGTYIVFGQHKFKLTEREARHFDGILEGYIDQTGTPDGFGSWMLQQLDLAASVEAG